MESYSIRGLTFTYPEQTNCVLDGLNFSIRQGEFITLAGPSGCGKSTLLRHLKTVLAPHGSIDGDIWFEGKLLREISQREQSKRIGFVMQNPENQIVTDKVWHELAFGLENLGYDTLTIRGRVAEMASFFGIEAWFYKNVSELSGGQKQMLNLASVMVMQPSILILDEPTSQLDPIASAEFIATLWKINRELGTTVLITEHRLEEVLPVSDRVLVMDRGKLICDGSPKAVGEQLATIGHSMFDALPSPMRIYAAVPNEEPCPITVRDGRLWLDAYAAKHPIDDLEIKVNNDIIASAPPIVELNDVWFKYEKELPDVVKGLSIKVRKGEFLAILGGNGTGKTTALSLISGIRKPYRGKVIIEGKEFSKHTRVRGNGLLGVLPQNPQTLFVKKTIEEDLLEVLNTSPYTENEKRQKLESVANLCGLNTFLSRHPYDLSGGEQQRAALAKVLLLEPKVLLLDEPTKGFDAGFKKTFGQILKQLLGQGVTLIMVSHDIEFCAEHSHRCAMFFDGNVVTVGTPSEIFSGNSFYTTASNRIARHLIPNAVTVEDVVRACKGSMPKLTEMKSEKLQLSSQSNLDWHLDTPIARDAKIVKGAKVISRQRIASLIILLAIPLTIFMGMYFLNDRKYYFISMLIILETLIPFLLVFEGRKPQARELVVISVLCAIGVAGRTAFFMVPQFKPVVAIVIISGVAFGAEAGFLVGAVTMFTSNMLFGQGPWTPWQMFAMGIIGFLAGLVFRKGILNRKRVPMSIFGCLATLIIYGGLMNSSYVFMYNDTPSWSLFLTAFAMGIPFDLIHAISTVIFLWFISQPMLEKLDRIKIKYGLIE